jgi:hypothetical protein
VTDEDLSSFEAIVRSGLRQRAQGCRPADDVAVRVSRAEARLARRRRMRSMIVLGAAVCSVALVIGLVAGVGRSTQRAPRPSAPPAGRWSAPLLIDRSVRNASLYSVSCPTASFCMAVDPSGTVFRWNGTSWSSEAIAPKALFAVSCPTTTFCMAVGDSGSPGSALGADALSWNGSHWSKPEDIEAKHVGHDTGVPATISCPTISFCMASDELGNLLMWDGSTWSATRGGAISSQITFINGSVVSCASRTFCMAARSDIEGGGPFVLRWNGDSWSQQEKIGGRSAQGLLYSVSCSSASFCMATGFFATSGSPAAEAVTWNGTTWSAPRKVASDLGLLQSVSCPSASFCMAVGGAGHALRWNGSSWSAPQVIDRSGSRLPGNDIMSVSCSSSATCRAVDGVGNVLNWRT